MRIYGNREIKTLPGRDTRPTTSKVREAVFNIWQDRVENARWLDLCAGNGSMGAEALCRGASQAVAIEKSPRACQIIRENWQKLIKDNQEFKVLRGDVIKRLKSLKGLNFDLIYFDPPYEMDIYNSVLNGIFEYNLLAKNGQIAVEFDPKKSFLNLENHWQLLQSKSYGNSSINFYHH